jgi:signal transduction histidine kinase
MTRNEQVKPVVLVVDDDEVGRLICTDLLLDNGFEVIEADDGQPALELFIQHKPDIILMDVMMKKMDGFAACQALRSLPGGATVPVLMVTGLNDVDSIEKAYDAGATDFIGKPFDWRILINRVRYMLRAERQFDHLRATERALSQAQRIALLGSFRWTVGTRRVEVSENLEKLLEIHAEDGTVSLQKMLRRIDPRVLPALMARLRGLGDNNRSFNLDCRLSGALASTRTVMIRLELERSAVGAYSVQGAIQDITDRKVMEHKLLVAKDTAETANAAKTAFLANMSHELRTPLNAIIGFSEMISTEMFGPVGEARYKDYANDIYLSGVHLLSLINDLLDVAKIEAGKMEIVQRPLDARCIIEDAIRLLSVKAREKNQTLEVLISLDAPALYADERAVRQILTNLVSNAVKFTPEGGRICVRVGPTRDGEFQLVCEDNGRGISAEKLAKIFAPFSQINNRFDREEGGSGFGLSLVRGLVRLHQGRVWLESEFGAGTRAYVVLPPKQQHAAGNTIAA